MLNSSARSPAWFRYLVVAVATLMLCSCRVALPEQQPTAAPKISDLGIRSATHVSLLGQKTGRAVVPAFYQVDPHSPPSEVRRAEYAAGVRPPACSCLSCSPAAGGPSTVCHDCPQAGPGDEYLFDGGDAGLPAGVRADWKIDGLEQEDTVAHYDTVDGRTVITPSNQVCIYAPRFGAVRRVVDLHQYARYDMPGGFENPLSLAKIDDNEEVIMARSQVEPTLHRRKKGSSALRERRQLGALNQEVRLAEFDGTLSLYADLQIVRVGTFNTEEKALLTRASLAATTWSGDQSPQVTIDNDQAQAAVTSVQPGAVYHTKEPNKSRLRLIKLASTGAARPGDQIEFTLRYDNIGNREMGNVTIADNLTPRLEFIPGSAKSSRESNFSTEPNSGGSVVLRWEIIEPVDAGQGGVLQFKCRVR
ncbi:MAG: hypothetical protein MK171_13015 [Pirellulales bacterium]|nr:hypothetical protein [Pirellulales bacterium]